MTRQYQVFGEAQIYLRFGNHVPLSPDVAEGGGTNPPNVWTLGLTTDPIKITVNNYHYGVKTDSYGPDVPSDTLCYLGDAEINLKLVFYDADPLNLWLRESFAGGSAGANSNQPAGIMPFAGTPMGAGLPIYASGNHYVGLGIDNPNPPNPAQYQPWRFPATYLTGPPVVYPLGTKRSIVECNVRALPYTPFSFDRVLSQEGETDENFQTLSFGAILFDHQAINI